MSKPTPTPVTISFRQGFNLGFSIAAGMLMFSAFCGVALALLGVLPQLLK